MTDVHIPEGALLQTWTYVPPAIIAIGTVGNALTLVTVLGRQCNKSSFTVYLASLAIFDTLVLYTLGINKWLGIVFGVTIERSGTVGCKLYFFASYLFPHTSSWLVVSLTVERTVASYFPQWYKLISKPRTGYICVAAIFAFLACLNSHLLYGNVLYTDENGTVCGFIDDEYTNFFFYYWAWIDFSVYCVIPLTLIIVANIATILRVLKSVRATATSASDSNKKRTRYLLAVTFLVSCTFVLLTSPLSIYLAFAPFLLEDLYNLTPAEATIESVFFMLMFVNHALNFFLYTLSGPRFRRDLKETLKTCLPRKVIRTEA